MHKILLLLVTGSFASTALAQSKEALQLRAQSQLRSSEYDAGAARFAASPDALECLVRKSDHIRVCHTREAWRAVAMRLERRDAPKR